MAIKDRALALSISALLALGLVGCAGLGSSEPEKVAVTQVEVQQPFEGRKPADNSTLDDIVAAASKTLDDNQAKVKSDTEETELAAKVNADFKKANDAYKAGDYASAQAGYEAVLKTYPLHYGANVNLTLALLQQEKNLEALQQAFVCVGLAPGDGAPLLNVQAAGVACGYSMEDLEDAMDTMVQFRNDPSFKERATPEGEYEHFYAYNKIWDRIETDLYDGAQAWKESSATAAESEAEVEAPAEEKAVKAEESAVQAEEAAAAQAEEAAAEEAMAEEGQVDRATTSKAYERLDKELADLEDELPDDKDVLALRAYLFAAGLQLGLEADPALIEPMDTIPYIAVDDSVCTIRVRELTKQNGEWHVMMEVTNKTEGDTLGVGRGKTWLINDMEVTPIINEISITPGLMEDVTLIVPDDSGAFEDGVTSIAGTIVVSSQSSNSVLARYPVFWKAPAAE